MGALATDGEMASHDDDDRVLLFCLLGHSLPTDHRPPTLAQPSITTHNKPHVFTQVLFRTADGKVRQIQLSKHDPDAKQQHRVAIPRPFSFLDQSFDGATAAHRSAECDISIYVTQYSPR